VMADEQEAADPISAERAGAMAARLARSETDIEHLRKGAAEVARRADVAEGHAESDRCRIEALEARAVVDREVLEELSAEGVVHRDRAASLEVALQSARLIGAAVGIIMARATVTEAAAFEILKNASQDSNFKVREIAEEIVITGDVTAVPIRRSRPTSPPFGPEPG
jgi:hypothetical protein